MNGDAGEDEAAGLTFRADAGRLDRVLAERLALPRAEVQRAIADGRVLVDGAVRPKSSCVNRCWYVRPSLRSLSSAETSAWCGTSHWFVGSKYCTRS